MFMGKPSYYEELAGYQLTISCPELPIRIAKGQPYNPCPIIKCGPHQRGDLQRYRLQTSCKLISLSYLGQES
jgi:hypothetical protein